MQAELWSFDNVVIIMCNSILCRYRFCTSSYIATFTSASHYSMMKKTTYNVIHAIEMMLHFKYIFARALLCDTVINTVSFIDLDS